MSEQDLPKQEVFYSFTKLLEILGISKSTASRWKKEERFVPETEINGVVRYSSFDIDKFVTIQNPHRLPDSSELKRQAAAEARRGQ